MKQISKLIIRDLNDQTTVEILGPNHPLINVYTSEGFKDREEFTNAWISVCLTTFHKVYFIHEVIYKD
jgi:hypothetical protein